MKRVEFEWRTAGRCRHPEFMTIKGGSFKPVDFPSNYGRIRHPDHGWILFDTGYSTHFHEATRPFPERLYAWTTPVHLDDEKTAANALRSDGISPDDVSLIIASHWHGDHIAGLRDFPNAKIAGWSDALHFILSRSRMKNLLQGYLPALIPRDIGQRLLPVESCKLIALDPSWQPFETGYDLLGDGSLIVVRLHGHACGHLGLIFRSSKDREIFLIADAVWNSESFRSLRLPHPLTQLISADAKVYRRTVLDLHALREKNPDAILIPSHCKEFGEGAV